MRKTDCSCSAGVWRCPAVVKDLASSVGMQVPELQPRTPEEAARQERETDLYAVMEKAENVAVVPANPIPA